MKKALPGGIVLALTLAFSQPQTTAPRFDTVVREDFFAGLGGDTVRFDRAMKKCEQILAREPKNPAALVWHGGGLYFQSGQAFRRGDTAAGLDLNHRGLQEMADAVALEPDSLQTRVPRAAILIASARFVDDALAKPLVEIGVADYERALALQKPDYATLSVHSKGEIMGGLADGYRRLGNLPKSREYLDRLVRELPGSAYEAQAKRWLADLSAVGKQERFCLGCHAGPEAR